jgi:hypothetical protein
MLAAVEFDDEAMFQAGEVGDVGIDRHLLAKFDAELMNVQPQPELALRIGHITT